MPLLSCECIAGFPLTEKLAEIYCSFRNLAEGATASVDSLPYCGCVSGGLSEQIANIYCAARAWTDDIELPSCDCVRGLPLSDQLTAIYEAIYTAAEDDSLPTSVCVRGLPLSEQLTSIYQAILTLTSDSDLPSLMCVRGLPLSEQIDALFCASLDVQLGFDPDAEAFFVAAGIVDETQKEAVNALVLDLKSALLWDKMVALYPFVGGTASTHSYNLVNPALHQITWNGVVTHNANGITGNGSTGYGDTGSAGSVFCAQDDMHISVYQRSVAPTDMGRFIGAVSTSGGVKRLDLYNNSGSVGALGVNDDTFIGGVPIQGFLMTARTAANARFLKTDLTLVNDAAASTGAVSQNPLILARSFEGFANDQFSNANLALASLGQSMTTAEAETYRVIVQTFQTALGRNV